MAKNLHRKRKHCAYNTKPHANSRHLRLRLSSTFERNRLDRKGK